MRKFLISAAVAASALAVAVPASAQWAPPPPPGAYGYGHQPYGYGQQPYGYQHNRGYAHARALQARLDHIQREIGRLAQYRMISRNEYHNLIRDSREAERSLRRNARDGRGLTFEELRRAERRIHRLEQKIARDVRDGRRYGFRW